MLNTKYQEFPSQKMSCYSITSASTSCFFFVLTPHAFRVWYKMNIATVYKYKIHGTKKVYKTKLRLPSNIALLIIISFAWCHNLPWQSSSFDPMNSQMDGVSSGQQSCRESKEILAGTKAFSAGNSYQSIWGNRPHSPLMAPMYQPWAWPWIKAFLATQLPGVYAVVLATPPSIVTSANAGTDKFGRFWASQAEIKTIEAFQMAGRSDLGVRNAE